MESGATEGDNGLTDTASCSNASSFLVLSISIFSVGGQIFENFNLKNFLAASKCNSLNFDHGHITKETL